MWAVSYTNKTQTNLKWNGRWCKACRFWISSY